MASRYPTYELLVALAKCHHGVKVDKKDLRTGFHTERTKTSLTMQDLMI
jgi:hypothetical protein